MIGQIAFDFLANSQKASIKSSSRPFVTFGQQTVEKDQRAPDNPGLTFVNFDRELTINNDKRRILFQHPFSEVRFDNVQIPASALLHFGIAIDPAVWENGGDGVSFRVTVVDEQSTRRMIMIFTEYLDPKHKSEDRKWRDYDVDLGTFSGRKVSFIFATDGGPSNNISYDWAVWSDLKIGVQSKN